MKRRSVLILITAILFMLLVFSYLLTYNRFFFPLGKLYGQLNMGMSYTEVQNLFHNYYLHYKDKGEIYFHNGLTTEHIHKGLIAKTKHLFLYHVSYFDDVQLQVLFDEKDRVKEIAFIGD